MSVRLRLLHHSPESYYDSENVLVICNYEGILLVDLPTEDYRRHALNAESATVQLATPAAPKKFTDIINLMHSVQKH